MLESQTDITTIVGIQSLSQPGPKDPWGKTAAGRFADVFIYSDVLHYILPVPEKAMEPRDVGIPDLLLRLGAKESELIKPTCACPLG